MLAVTPTSAHEDVHPTVQITVSTSATCTATERKFKSEQYNRLGKSGHNEQFRA